MSAEWVNAIAQTVIALAMTFTLLSTLRNGRKIDHSTAKVEEIRKATDGLTAQLVASTAKASEAKGRAEGLEQGRSDSR